MKQLKWGDGLFACLLIVTVLVLYGDSVRYGLIWDDPRFYHTTAGPSSLWQILTSPQPPTFQFYRPVAVLYNRSLVSSTGIVHAPVAHMVQIAGHLLVTLLIAPVLRALKFDATHARLAAWFFAIFPFSYQAVAWQQNQQPLMFVWVLLAALAARQFCQRHSILFLSLSLVAYAVALLLQEGSLLFVFVFFWLAACNWQDTARRWRGWPLLHLGVAALYALIWLSMPRQSQVTGQGFQMPVLGYLLQGIVFPVSHLIAGQGASWPLPVLIALFALVWLLLALGVCKWKSAYAAALSCVWIVIGFLPIWAGLSWEYVQPGPRLLYPASLGIAGLWGGWAAWTFAPDQARWRRGLGGLVLVMVLTVSLLQWRQFQKLYQIGTNHLSHAIEVLAATPDAHLAFVNFPDRIEMRARPYPLGFWGLVLSPVIQNLSDFARAKVGYSAKDRSFSSFQVDADERHAWPYRVDMRGVDSDPAALLQAARWADMVYLTRYRPDGTLDLQAVGDVRPASPITMPLAIVGDSVQLADASGTLASRTLTLRLSWRCLKPLRNDDTIFVHFWKDDAYVGDADGDSLGGLIPLSIWQAETEIVDVRHIDVSSFAPGRYQVRVGLYNRADGTRYPAQRAGGARFWADEIPVYIFDLP